jgi:hypothetical protein
LVRFRFYKPETEKTKPNRTQTGKNRAKPVWTGFVLKNRTETDRFELVSVQVQFHFFLKKIQFIFFYKNQIKPKIIIPISHVALPSLSFSLWLENNHNSSAVSLCAAL